MGHLGMNVFIESLLIRVLLCSVVLLVWANSPVMAQSNSMLEFSHQKESAHSLSSDLSRESLGDSSIGAKSVPVSASIGASPTSLVKAVDANLSNHASFTPHNDSATPSNSKVISPDPRLNQNLAVEGLEESLLEDVPPALGFLVNNTLNGPGLSIFQQLPLSDIQGNSTPKLWRYGKLFATSSSTVNPEPELPYGEVSLILNPSVERKIRYFQTVIPDRFQEWLDRFQKYKPVVEQIFAELGLPQELMYLSVIESGFNPRAYSRARAAGPWQFMKGTGSTYGLRVNWYIDERRDPIKSTVAAAQHLRDLYDRFGSWPLALAAYNAGTGKISRAIKKSGTRDYWKIRRTRYIRRETRDYVPKYMAATIIATNPTLFGFRVESDKVHEYDEVLMKDTIHLRTVANKAGLAFEDLRYLNPELRRSITPPQKDGYFLKVPVGMGYHVESVRDELKQWAQPPPQANWYRVRSGDSLSVIAHRFNMNVRKLKGLNNLSGNLIHVGQRLRVREGAKFSKEGDATWYRVRRGDSLWTIAKRFSVSVRDLKVLNNLRSSVIQAGRMLMVSP